MYKIEEKDLGNGASEIGIRSKADNSLVAVITHPCAGAKWFLHRMNKFEKEKFKTKKAALAEFSA